MPTLPCCPRSPARLLALTALLSTAALAQEGGPYYLGTNVGLTHVSNLFRVSDVPNGDRVTSVGVLGGLDRRLGRQHVTLDANLQNNRYADNPSLNNTSSNLRGTLDWQTIGDLSGTVSVSRNRSLAEYNIGSGVVPIFRRNVQTLDDYQAKTRLGLVSRYSLEAGVSHRRQAFTASEYDRYAYSQNVGSLGVAARPGSALKLGLSGRYTKGAFPRYPILVGNIPVGSVRADYRRHDLDATASWSPGGAHQIDTRLSRSQTRNSVSGINSFRGTTGQITWNWQPTPKTGLRVQAGHDAGTEVQASGVDASRIYNYYSGTFTYTPTGKLSLQATLGRNRSHVANPLSPVEFFDVTTNSSLTARWAFTRWLSVSCQLAHASRDSSVVQYVYTANSYGCSGQALLF